MAGKRGKQNREPSAADTARRHEKIVKMKLDGMSASQIAAELELAQRTVELAWAKWRDSEKHSLVEEDPLDVVFEHIAGFRQLRALAVKVFEECAGTTIKGEDGSELTIGVNGPARVGALRLVAELRARELSLRQDTGLLPRNLGQVSIAVDVRYWTEQILTLFREYDVPAEAQDRLLALLEEPEPQRELPAA